MSTAPLVGAKGEALSSATEPPLEIARPQVSPFPQVAGLSLQRTRPAIHGQPETYRLTLAMLCTVRGAGKMFQLDVPMTLRARPLAAILHHLGQQLDALADHYELTHEQETRVQPAPDDPAAAPSTSTAHPDSPAAVDLADDRPARPG